jgi:hypothetical protein
MAASWISEDASAAIAESLSMSFSNCSKLMNAKELERALKDAIGSGTADKYVVIFTKDVIPYNIYNVLTRSYNIVPTPTPLPPGPHETLLVKFLQKGGIVVWLGDVPLWYVSQNKNKTEIWQNNYINFFGVLGIVQIFSDPPQPAYSIYKNLDLGSWLSMRPVLYPGYSHRPNTEQLKEELESCIHNQGFVPLAETKVLQAAAFIPRDLHIDRKIVKVEDLVPGPGFTAFSAWIRCIGDGMFIRLWDHMITDINKAKEYALKILQIISTIISAIIKS